MKMSKSEISRTIDKLKSIVQKSPIAALEGVLVKDGYLIASNTEVIMQVKMEASEGESFIIPAKAFDLIKNLPEGEVEITADQKNVVTIKMAKIKNSYQSFPVENFSYAKTDITAIGEAVLPGERLIEGIGHVIYAVDEKNSNRMMGGICFEGSGSGLNLVALDGHVIAWDHIDADGVAAMKIIVPKSAAKKLLSIDMNGDVMFSYDDKSAVFKTKDCTVYTRLIDGNFFSYEKFFDKAPICTIINRQELIGAMTRAKLCTDERTPTVFNISGDELNVAVKDKVADYQENLHLQMEMENPLKIGFDSRLVIETIKAFTCDNITLNFTSASLPMIVEAEDSDMKAVVLPIRIE